MIYFSCIIFNGGVNVSRLDKYKNEYRKWCESLGVSSVADLNAIVRTPKLSEFVSICEARHEQELSKITAQIRDGNRRLVFIAGPSGAGKTTTSLRLISHLAAVGIHAVPISLDNYYMDKSLMPKNDKGEPDFEALGSIDYKLFNKNIAELTDTGKAVIPMFNFKLARVISDAKAVTLDKDSVVIVEGIHGLNPLIADNIPDNLKYRLYCTPLSVMTDSDGERISSQSVRMTRRLIRDCYYRSSDYRVTFSLWQNQERSAEKNIFPYTDTADFVLNTALPYEFGVYKTHLLDVLRPAPDDDEDIGIIRYLRHLAESFDEISREFSPENSIIREFVGGSSLKYS